MTFNFTGGGGFFDLPDKCSISPFFDLSAYLYIYLSVRDVYFVRWPKITTHDMKQGFVRVDGWEMKRFSRDRVLNDTLLLSAGLLSMDVDNVQRFTAV